MWRRIVVFVTHSICLVAGERAVVDVHGRRSSSGDRPSALKIVPFPAAGHGAERESECAKVRTKDDA